MHCSTTLHGFSEVVAASFTADDVLVDFAGRDVVVSLQSHVEESLVVAEIKIHLSSIIQHKYLAYTSTVAEWLACWTQAQNGLGSNHSRDAVG